MDDFYGNGPESEVLKLRDRMVKRIVMKFQHLKRIQAREDGDRARDVGEAEPKVSQGHA